MEQNSKQETAGRISRADVEKHTNPKPSIGRIVHYRLSAADADKINNWRISAPDLHVKMENGNWIEGTQAHVGDTVYANDIFPMLITKVWGSERDGEVDGQVFLDGNDVLWVKGVTVGTEPGHFVWPVSSTR